MEHTKLAISIPTYNRPRHIKEYLELMIEPTRELNISIYIFDSSEGDETGKVVKGYIEKGYLQVLYEHIPNAGLEKIYKAYTSPDADYVWVCSDRRMIQPVNYYSIMSYIDQGYDAITVYMPEYSKQTKKKDYCIAEEYFRDCAWCITCMGSTIIKRNLLQTYSLDRYLNSKGSGFQHVAMFANALNRKQIKAVFIPVHKNKLIKSSRYNTSGGSSDRMLEIWNKEWYICISLLPKRYRKYKIEMLHSIDQNLHWFHLAELCSIKNQLLFAQCWRYRMYISKVMQMPLPFVLLVALMPKWVTDIISMLFGKTGPDNNYT